MLSNENYKKTLHLVKRLLGLKVENLKLTMAEKLTVLLGATSIAMVALILGAITIAFLALSLARYLSEFMPLYYGYLISAGLLTLIFITIVLFRRVLILNPLARFLSRLFFD